MTPAELLGLVKSQPIVSESRTVRVRGEQLQALLERGKRMLLTELLAHPDQRSEEREYRFGHLVGAGVESEELLRWQREHPQHRLPQDLLVLLRAMDGIHLWADLAIGRSYFGILPLCEWEDARHTVLARVEPPPEGVLVLSYHQNGDYFLLLDTARCTYTWFDPQDPCNSAVVATSASELLDWLFNKASELRPPGA